MGKVRELLDFLTQKLPGFLSRAIGAIVRSAAEIKSTMIRFVGRWFISKIYGFDVKVLDSLPEYSLEWGTKALSDVEILCFTVSEPQSKYEFWLLGASEPPRHIPWSMVLEKALERFVSTTHNVDTAPAIRMLERLRDPKDNLGLYLNLSQIRRTALER